ncbi:ABC transporter permease subunit [Candidatus Aerophobetes bacterium]|nr:ABC transporter permease subunit [Candidatus Aerophobetes bacterium]
MAKGSFSLTVHSIKVLIKRELVSSLQGWGFYGAIFVSLIVCSFLLKNFMGGIREENILISSYPLNFPLFVSVIIISFYLVVISAISISREREQGTLEILFYGPVSSFSFTIGKYFKDIFLYLITLIFFAAYFFGVSALTNLGFTYSLVKSLGLSIFWVSCVISFGLFISSLTGRVRSSIIWLVAILLAFLAIQFAHSAFLSFPKEALSTPLLYLRRTLYYLSKGISWVSPFSYISRGMESIQIESMKLYLLNIGYCIVYSVIFLTLSVYILKLKGVRG